ncbi:MAG: sugar ABC transporter permease [Lachnospiraceae bacterium]|nr:sugar ABC transporter permease [Lachnospiraceae bacterium]
MLISTFLPFAGVRGDTKMLWAVAFAVLGSGEAGFLGSLYLAAAICIVISAACGAFLFAKPSIKGVRVWIVIQAVETVFATMLLFASKGVFDRIGIFTGKFMAKDFGIGFWLLLIASYVTLHAAMKTIKVHPGYIVLVILSVIWLFPILWIILTAFRAESGYYVGYFFPKGLTLDNFKNLFTNDAVIPFGRWWLNTFIIAIFTCILNTIIILMTSYVLSRTRFRSRVTLMKIMMIIGMFPGFMSMVAVYNILKGIGMAQTLVSLIIVSAAGAAMGYYICKGFFDTIPKSMDEAAIIDGATRWQIFTRITIPLSKPIIIYTILTSFIGPWGDYIFPSMVLGDKQNSYTVALGLKWLTDFQRIDSYYTQFAAGSLLVSVPIVILFICLQRFYVEGLSGSVKG